MDGWSTTLLVAHNSFPLRIPMAVEAHPALADHLIGLVDMVQALKLNLGIQLRPVTLCYACTQLQANLHLRSVHDVTLYQPWRYALLLNYSYTITVSNANSKHHRFLASNDLITFCICLKRN